MAKNQGPAGSIILMIAKRLWQMNEPQFFAKRLPSSLEQPGRLT